MSEVAFRTGFEREKTKGRWLQVGETPDEEVASKPFLLELNSCGNPWSTSGIISGNGPGTLGN